LSGKKEEIDIWTSYITKKSNKINSALLPKQVQHLHRGLWGKEKDKKRKAVVNAEEPITKRPTIATKRNSANETSETKRPTRGRLGGVKSSGSAEQRKAVVNAEEPITKQPTIATKRNSANETSETKRPTRGIANWSGQSKRKRSNDTLQEVELNLGRSARNAWKERNGEDLPEITPFGDSYGTIGTVWTQSIAVSNQSPVYTTTDYPPSVLDDCAVPLPDQDGVAFRRKADATSALYWWIICTVPSVESRRHWARELLGELGSATLVIQHIRMAWCTLSQSNDGSFWLEYKGRKCLLA
jgi:hypothetical protein